VRVFPRFRRYANSDYILISDKRKDSQVRFWSAFVLGIEEMAASMGRLGKKPMDTHFWLDNSRLMVETMAF